MQRFAWLHERVMFSVMFPRFYVYVFLCLHAVPTCAELLLQAVVEQGPDT